MLLSMLVIVLYCTSGDYLRMGNDWVSERDIAERERERGILLDEMTLLCRVVLGLEGKGVGGWMRIDEDVECLSWGRRILIGWLRLQNSPDSFARSVGLMKGAHCRRGKVHTIGITCINISFITKLFDAKKNSHGI